MMEEQIMAPTSVSESLPSSSPPAHSSVLSLMGDEPAAANARTASESAEAGSDTSVNMSSSVDNPAIPADPSTPDNPMMPVFFGEELVSDRYYNVHVAFNPSSFVHSSVDTCNALLGHLLRSLACTALVKQLLVFDQ